MSSYSVNHLQQLESESIFILRETAAQFQRPVLLFSGGKDSIVVAHLAKKAFWPGKMPFPLMHVDTGHNFPETISYRDEFVGRIGAHLVVARVQDSIDQGRVQEETGANASRNALQTVTLLDAIEEHQFDCALGGARRDEEKARAKERFFSHRDEFGQWDPKNQRPELWNVYNSKVNKGESIRVFPLSNWTELDIWLYIKQENILFDLHAYEKWMMGTALDEGTLAARLQALRDGGFAVLFGECGVINSSGLMSGFTLFLDAMLQSNFPTLAWLWKYDGGIF